MASFEALESFPLSLHILHLLLVELKHIARQLFGFFGTLIVIPLFTLMELMQLLAFAFV